MRFRVTFLRNGRFFLLTALFMCGGCLSDKISEVGMAPQLTQIQDPTLLPNYRPVTMPMPRPRPLPGGKGNSLWESGSRAFFKDQRACNVGDILSVSIDMDQRQLMEVRPQMERETSSRFGIQELLGIQPTFRSSRHHHHHAGRRVANQARTTDWLDASSHSKMHGRQSRYDLHDRMQFTIAATVVQLLPNGNMVVHGRMETRLVNELREVEIRGIVRPQDIGPNNTIAGSKIAELRIIYGGRGDLTDMQTIPWGQQILNKVAPF